MLRPKHMTSDFKKTLVNVVDETIYLTYPEGEEEKSSGPYEEDRS